MPRNVAFIADSLDNAYKFQKILAALDVNTAAGSTLQLTKMLAPESKYELVIFEARGQALARAEELASYAESKLCPTLFIVNEEDISEITLPKRSVGDFVTHEASLAECESRVKRLLESSDENAVEIVTVDNMVINLATYQVTVSGQPIDFTYLEYALLSFLAQHAGHAYSRDELLQYVWGFDYYGGSRTVVVHVRRIRAKLGPELAQHLETVRSVGYLWN